MTTDVDQINNALASNYILVDVELRQWTGKRKDNVVSGEVLTSKGASKDGGYFTKNLLASAGGELKEIHQRGNTLRHYVYANTLPWSSSTSGAQRGERLLATSLSMNFLSELKTLQTDYEAAVQALTAAWPTRVAEAMRALGTLADATDYPDAHELAELFSVSVDLRPIPAVGDFSRLNVPAALAGALADKHAEQAQSQLDNAMASLRDRIIAELTRINTQMSKHANGEKTRLYDSLIGNMQSLVQMARSMNIGNNAELATLADDIEKKLLKVPVEAYKGNIALAGEAAKAAAALIPIASAASVWGVKPAAPAIPIEEVATQVAAVLDAVEVPDNSDLDLESIWEFNQ